MKHSNICVKLLRTDSNAFIAEVWNGRKRMSVRSWPNTEDPDPERKRRATEFAFTLAETLGCDWELTDLTAK